MIDYIKYYIQFFFAEYGNYVFYLLYFIFSVSVILFLIYYIDSKEVNILDSGGMMLIEAPAGFHEIRFEYRTPGYLLGAVISVISISLFLLYLAYCFMQMQMISGCFVHDTTTHRRK